MVVSRKSADAAVNVDLVYNRINDSISVVSAVFLLLLVVVVVVMVHFK